MEDEAERRPPFSDFARAGEASVRDAVERNLYSAGMRASAVAWLGRKDKARQERGEAFQATQSDAATRAAAAADLAAAAADRAASAAERQAAAARVANRIATAALAIATLALVASATAMLHLL